MISPLTSTERAFFIAAAILAGETSAMARQGSDAPPPVQASFAAGATGIGSTSRGNLIASPAASSASARRLPDNFSKACATATSSVPARITCPVRVSKAVTAVAYFRLYEGHSPAIAPAAEDVR